MHLRNQSLSVCIFFKVDSFSYGSHAFSDKLISGRLHKQTEKKTQWREIRKKNEDNLNWYCNYKCVCYWQWYCSLGTSSSLVYFVWRIKVQRENIQKSDVINVRSCDCISNHGIFIIVMEIFHLWTKSSSSTSSSIC